MSLGMEVLQPLNGKRLAGNRDVFEEGVVLTKRFCAEQRQQQVIAMEQDQQCVVQPVDNNALQKQAQKQSEPVNTLTAEESTTWIVHGCYSPRVVQSFCRPDECVAFRGDCY